MEIPRRCVLGGLASGLVIAAGNRAKAKPDRKRTLKLSIDTLIAENKVPALGFGLVRAGEVAWVAGFGFADLEARRPATADTAFHLASVSKVVTGTALMQLWEVGRFKLDDPIGPVLDFPVLNPRHPAPVTFRQLFTHTSTISDQNYRGFERCGDPKLALRDFLVGYLTPGGKSYTPEGSFEDADPGQRYAYSNVGIALAGYLAERLGGASLQSQTKARIFAPLKMTPAAWSLADLGDAPRTTPYVEQKGKLTPIRAIGYPDWPAGLLRASPRAMTQFIAAYATGGRLHRVSVLRASTIRMMLEAIAPPPLPDGHILGQGLFWEEISAEPKRFFGKFGMDDGAHTLIAFDPDLRNGVVILANRSATEPLQRAMIKLAVQALL
jgi:CubicO group peptidase (beta-lactamase class C family)